MKRIGYTLVLGLLAASAVIGWRHWRAHRFDAFINEAARRYQLPPALIRSVIRQESNFDPTVRGRAGELGLMQIRDVAASEWAYAEHISHFEHVECLNPLTNILAGSWYLKHAVQHYKIADDPIPFALAEYNAGRGNVLKWLDGGGATNSADFIRKIGFPATKLYVRNVLDMYHSD